MIVDREIWWRSLKSAKQRIETVVVSCQNDIELGGIVSIDWENCDDMFRGLVGDLFGI